jgi:hypothetical protein
MKRNILMLSVLMIAAAIAVNAQSTLPSGTEIKVRTDAAIPAKPPADTRYTASVSQDVMDANGHVLIPRGSRATLIAVPTNDGKDTNLDLRSVNLNGRNFFIEAAGQGSSGTPGGLGANKRTGIYVGGGAAVGAIDRIDNDNNISGVGDGVTHDVEDPAYNRSYDASVAPGNGVPGVQTGGYAVDGTPDTRGIMEKTADAVTGDNLDDKTGKPISYDNRATWDPNAPAMPSLGNNVPGVQTGGRLADGSSDSRGILEKTADAVTGDNWDDKQGKPVDPAYATIPNRTWDTAAPGNGVPGVQTGGRAVDGTPDTRGILEKTADAVTGDSMDDKTGKRVP